MSSIHGKFVWHELLTTDTAAGGAFYSAVIGWTTHVAGQALTGADYTVFERDGARAAGMMPLPQEARDEGSKPFWIGYIGADDVDAASEKVTALGGKVHRPPADIPGIGRFALVSDPQGAPFVLFDPAPTQDGVPPPSTGLGAAGWSELMATDVVGALDFYSRMFGWTQDRVFDMGPMGDYHIFSNDGDVSAGGMMTAPAGFPGPFWCYYFRVDGIKAAAARITSAGGKVVNGPHQVPGGDWIVQGLDLQGVFFCLLSAAE